MSNKSYPIKENSNVMKVQGGEQKVMKKILTVALSTAMAFSMFASVAFGDSAVSVQEKYNSLEAKGIFNGYPDKQAHLERDMTRAEFAKVLTKLLGLKEVTGTLSYKDKGYDAKNWAVPYIEAVTAAGIMEGQDKVKQIFNYNGKVTVEEMATALVRALKLEVPTTGDNSSSSWAKGYVQVAIDKGLIAKDVNFQANATREQLVNAAYQAEQIINLSVKEYKIAENGKDIEFTLSSGEVVKVTLEKALEPNKETEVKFKNAAGQEITAKVTWVVDEATKVASVAATNLKEVVVTFDGTVDPASATNKNNYTVAGKNIDSIALNADKKVATILLAESDTLTNQKEISVKVSNVKSSKGTRTISQTVNFTPSDVTIPEVKEVKGLGTKAFKVTFSEPVRSSDVVSSNFTIDGKAIAANVQYTYPNTAIVITNLTEGEHTLRVSNVRDFSGLTVVPVEKQFTVTQDTTAPKVVSASSYDLKEVTVEFDEPVKAVGGAYANVSSFKPSSIQINDNKVTLKFSSNLNYTENTIYLTGVRDYSDNSGNVDTKVTPTLDVTAPTVVSTDFSQELNGDYVAKIQLSKEISFATATDRTNYVLKDSKGDVVKVGGLNTNGNPVQQPTLSTDNKTVTVNLGKNLSDDYYTLTVSGLRDRTVAGNVLLPYDVRLDVNQASTGALTRAWFEGNYVYLEFNKTIATSGAGSAIDAAKYRIEGTNARLTNQSADIEPVGSNTVRIYARNFVAAGVSTLKGKTVIASYVGDIDGNYFSDDSNTVEAKQVIQDSKYAITTTSDEVTATSTNEIEVTFTGPLSTVRADEFTLYSVTGDTYTPVATATGYTASNNNKTITLKFADNAIPAAFASKALVLKANTSSTRDAFGNTLNINVPIINGIKPEVTATGAVYAQNPVADDVNKQEIVVDFSVSKPLAGVQGSVTNLRGLFSGTLNDQSITVTNVEVKDRNVAGTAVQKLVVTLKAPKSAVGTLYLNFNGDANAKSKFLVSSDGNDTPLAGFTQYVTVPAFK